MIGKLSPAKVNLYLRVFRKREDGYHDIASLMQRISLYDEMTFSPIERDIVVRCPDSSLPGNEENIVYRAANAIFSSASCASGIEITIGKRIPVAAGLGGGSSNAATTLMTINEMFGFRYSIDDLMKIGAKLGADIPFFIFGKTAWALGIGDLLQAADNIPPLWFVLINPRFGISTRMVYENLNLRLTKGSINYTIPRFQAVDGLLEVLRNDLEQVTFGLYPVLRHLKNLLLEYGALGALMSGSGPTVFGIFSEEKAALKAKEALEEAGRGKWSVLSAHSI
ncbi:MAG: 4-(cytidine 5'-diphospho)-2-C-methyl-D-erythritol kinase [Syntrophales bacterium]|nr:4-(cytidine 5'-diphospho)-2-C-methyl-D-erythritol kinase [Syntrophales bacterium]